MYKVTFHGPESDQLKGCTGETLAYAQAQALSGLGQHLFDQPDREGCKLNQLDKFRFNLISSQGTLLVSAEITPVMRCNCGAIIPIDNLTSVCDTCLNGDWSEE